jgi:hypothetical protein
VNIYTTVALIHPNKVRWTWLGHSATVVRHLISTASIPRQITKVIYRDRHADKIHGDFVGALEHRGNVGE